MKHSLFLKWTRGEHQIAPIIRGLLKNHPDVQHVYVENARLHRNHKPYNNPHVVADVYDEDGKFDGYLLD